MNNLWQEIKVKMLHSGSKIGLLIGINVFVFLFVNISSVVYQLLTYFGNTTIETTAFQYLALPSSITQLGHRFWTPITYMFMHQGIFHILFNMLWLYWIGQIFEEYLGNKRIVSLYFLGGLAGAFLFVASYNIFPAYTTSGLVWGSTVVGASACVMAIVIATATLLPDYTIYLMFLGPVKLKWLAIGYVIFDFLSIAGSNSGGGIAHIGGMIVGFIYIKQLQRGNDWSKPLNNLFKAKPKLKVVSRGNPADATRTAPRQEEVDRILDKISQSGFDSLNKQEKETLSRASHNQ